MHQDVTCNMARGKVWTCLVILPCLGQVFNVMHLSHMCFHQLTYGMQIRSMHVCMLHDMHRSVQTFA